MIALIDLDFANNQGVEQFLQLLIMMQQLNEAKQQTFALEKLQFDRSPNPLMFGRRANNFDNFRDNFPLSGILET